MSDIAYIRTVYMYKLSRHVKTLPFLFKFLVYVKLSVNLKLSWSVDWLTPHSTINFIGLMTQPTVSKH